MIQFSGGNAYLLCDAAFEGADTCGGVVHPISQILQRGVGVQEHIGAEDILTVGELVSFQLR